MIKKLAALGIVGLLASATAAHADSFGANIFYNTLTDPSMTTLGGQGFGNTTTILTVHDNSHGVTIQSGCVGAGPADGSGSCGGEKTLNGAGTTVAGGQEAPPAPNSVKNAFDSFTTLGITSASDIGVIFNGGTSGGNDVTLQDVSFKFYNSAGTGLLDLSDAFSALPPQPGQGSSGYLITIDPNAMLSPRARYASLPWVSGGAAETTTAAGAMTSVTAIASNLIATCDDTNP